MLHVAVSIVKGNCRPDTLEVWFIHLSDVGLCILAAVIQHCRKDITSVSFQTGCAKELTSAGFGPLTRATRGLEAEDADTEYSVFVEGVTETTVRTNQIPLVKHKAVSGNTCFSFCGRDRKRVLNVCERCQSVFYCHVQCQRAHFQLACVPLQKNM
jgi:hypothetical protein